MDGPEEWIGAQISWRVSRGCEPAVVFGGQIDTAEDIGDGIVRIAGAISTGGRFVLVTNCQSVPTSN
jgi:hypothetical protein